MIVDHDPGDEDRTASAERGFLARLDAWLEVLASGGLVFGGRYVVMSDGTVRYTVTLPPAPERILLTTEIGP